MARDTISPNASSKKVEATELIQHWLFGENTYQFNKNYLTHRGHPRQSRDYILSTEIPNKWGRFQHFRRINRVEPDDLRLRQHVGQNILKACAAARAAYVWDEVDREPSHDLESAQDKSWSVLSGYLNGIRDGERLMPGYDLLDKKDVKEAVEAYAGKKGAYARPVAAYIGMVGLSLTALIEQTATDSTQKRELVLPEPGVPSGSIETWKH
jgi:hypothetical protein